MNKDWVSIGGLHRYVKTGRTLFSDLAICDHENRWLYGIAEIQHNDIVVFLKKHVGRSPDNLSYTMIKVLTGSGEVGWVSWNFGDWEKVR